MYRLYGAPGRASAAPEAILEDLTLTCGVTYEYIHTGPEQRADDAYRKLNPLGLVPTLIDDDRAIFESAAICIYLCDRHPAGGLAPAIDSPLRGRFYQWMFFLSNTLQPTYMHWFYPEKYCSDPAGAAVVKRDAEDRLRGLWRELDRTLAEAGPFLVGDRLTACDIYAHMLSTWHRASIVPLDTLEHAARMLDRTAQRPGVVKMMVRNAGH